MNYLLSLLPIALYLLILRALDSFSLAKWRLLLAGTVLLLMKNVMPRLTISAALSVIPSILIHMAYNLAQENNVANPLLLMCFAVVVFLSLFIILFGYGEKRIYKWMDHSLTVDIQTLSAIRSGNFASTRAGQYMMAIKEQFKPE